MDIFIELSLIITITTFVSFIMKRLKQPLVVGYILSGLLLGPMFLNLIQSTEIIEIFSKLGISILLFIVGIHLSPKIIKEVGSVSLITGVGQVLFTSIIGFALSIFLGLDTTAAMYVAIALTFSSTIIILKLLSDKGDVHSLYGKIAVGFLLVQDVIATIILIIVSSTASAQGTSIPLVLLTTLLKGGFIVIVITLLEKVLLPKLLKAASDSSELLFIFSLSWGLGFSALFYALGLSVEIGALISGVVLSSSAYAEEISSRLRPLRDFFIVMFFVLLGSSMTFSGGLTMLIPVVVLSLFVLVGNPVIVLIIMNLLGFHKKTGFQAGLTVAQISEFSLILATLAFHIGHINKDILTMITLVGLITIAGSTYLILYSEPIYQKIEKYLSFLELRKNNKSTTGKYAKVESFIFGFNRVGTTFMDTFKDLGYTVGVVDFDPNTLDRLPKKGAQYYYGDAQDVEFLGELPLSYAKFVVSSIKDLETNATLVKHLKDQHKNAIIIVFAETSEDAQTLYDVGANYVVLPHFIGADSTAKFIKRVGYSKESFEYKKEQILKQWA
ncbi:MAG: sodium:proton exchanger [Candidatus Pacebacteria bacterium]|nr:sodium:proton exchanger [Candidatus Paceibacterota bacterium]PIR63899.1 MAG: sodium:proton exchanger [Candidatus Pacebacteria bacterium CG10_big_fil_rev_8_21_14_0_10_40_26]PIZ78323.1 MAG: sodium:proton exchanger [Candidatus Pacebacteria bacterium CG_4_10_14_0_2_um_filter_40_20]PJA68633.1 MAG: sodium:proton exchanger [Candidatus Pacebacteria bacterium CG_4_9_14_3_um_filter_40_12]PJC41573.1 MAG: sodium:proton exchanger [Candidatus Pacebacteria bacterium CG_4_9_14_0_2_um_filter_40_15]